jgi:GntR family transcriptional regulator
VIIQIENDSEIPIYTQLTNQLTEGIAKGYLQAGVTLPSVRMLAADLGVNMHTVNKSYHELEKKGIIEIVPKSGAVIKPPRRISEGDSPYLRLSSELKPLIAEALVIGMEQTQIEHLVSNLIQDIKNK